MEESENTNGAFDNSGALPQEGLTHNRLTEDQHKTLEPPIGAHKYEFFGDDSLLGNLGALSGGLEDGVDAPPEEDFLVSQDASRDTLDLDDCLNPDYGKETLEDSYDPSAVHTSAQINGHGPGLAALETLHLGEDHSLLHSMRLSNPEEAKLISDQSQSLSFLSDPVAGAPQRSGSLKSDWSIGRPQQTQAIRAPEVLDAKDHLRASLPGSMQHFDPWASQAPGLKHFSDQEQQPPQYSTQQPLQQQSLNWQQQQAALAPRLYGPPKPPQSTPLYSQIPQSNPLGQIDQTPAPKRTLTVRELEAQLLGQISVPSQNPNPARLYPPNPNRGIPATQQLSNSGSFPSQLLRRSMPGALSADRPNWMTQSLPSGIPIPSRQTGYGQNLGSNMPGRSFSPPAYMSRSPSTQQHGLGSLNPQSPHPFPNQVFNISGGEMRGSPQHMYGPLLHQQRQASAAEPRRPPFPSNQPQLYPMNPHANPQNVRRSIGRGGFAAPPHPPGQFPLRQMPRLPLDQMGDLGNSTPWRRSKYMEPEEIDSILRIQWKSLHSRSPYQEDYYYQAYVHLHTNGSNRRIFAPDALRDLAPSEKAGAEPASYVKLDGLGKIAYSSVRRPKPLMDTVSQPLTAEIEGEDAENERKVRPLEEEPQLAARIVIEDCMCLLLDIDDIDRVWMASNGQREDEHLLRQRRLLLLDAFASALRLPEGALPPVGPMRASDDVFIRLMGLHKGRKMLARTIRLMLAPLANPAGYAGPAGRRAPPLRIVWAALRNVRLLFAIGKSVGSANSDIDQSVAATTELASAIVEVLGSLQSFRAICDCMAALVQGDLGAKQASELTHADNLLPLSPAGEPAGSGISWLAEVVTALLQQAQEVGLCEAKAQGSRSSEGLAVPEGAAWRDCFAAFLDLILRHLKTLCEVCRLAQEAGALEAAQFAKQIVPIGLIRASLPHASEAQREQIRATLIQL